MLTEEGPRRRDSGVAFIGAWRPGRKTFMVELAERGIPLAIYGDRWTKAPEWSIIQRHKGPKRQELRGHQRCLENQHYSQPLVEGLIA